MQSIHVVEQGQISDGPQEAADAKQAIGFEPEIICGKVINWRINQKYFGFHGD